MKVRRMGRTQVIEPVGSPNCGHEVVLATREGQSFVTEPAASTPAPTVEVPDVADVRAAAVILLRAIVEIIAGHRQAVTLAGRMSGEVQRYAHAAMLQHRDRPVRIRSMHLSRPVEPVIEAALVIDVDGRIRALAAGICQMPGGGWLCHTLRIL
ncbi:MAG: Rv3235 family protein [Actinomycetia bacterium]|nr:Rv3235 family protein [Actinomycetes bacterium]